jgi:hypothetical protein
MPLRALFWYALPSLMTSVAALPMALFVSAFYAVELGLPLAALDARAGSLADAERFV